MTTSVQGRRKDGREWTPTFIVSLNEETCIGCGRCYKVCSQNVFSLFMPDEDDDDDSKAAVMKIENEGNCIGCGACARVCVKKCQTFLHMELS